MNKQFGKWYRSVNLGCNDTILKNRWSGIEMYIKKPLTAVDLENLVRMFFLQKTPPEAVEGFADSFLSFDSAFDYDNKQEVALLSGAALLEIVTNDRDHKASNVVCLLVESMTFLEKAAVQSEIINSMRHFFIQTKRDLREKITFVDKNLRIPTGKSLLAALATDTGDYRKELKSFVEALPPVLHDLKALQQEQKMHFKLLHEDSQILWWVINKWDDILNKPYRSFSSNVAAAYAGIQLAGLVNVIPGPFSAHAVLHEILSVTTQETNVDLGTLVMDLDPEWVKNVVEQVKCVTEGFQPIMLALQYANTFGNLSQWEEKYEKTTGVNPRKAVWKSNEYAYQIYNESLLTRGIGEYTHE